MSIPFFHLKTDQFWKLVPRKPGATIPQEARASLTNLRTFVQCAELHKDWFALFLSKHERCAAADMILRRYFSEEVGTLLKERLHMSC
jgi:hypothetical protein